MQTATVLWLMALAIGMIGAAGFGYQFRKILAVKKKDRIETKVETLISEAKAKQKEILLEANDKALKIIEDSKREGRERQQEMTRAQKRLEQRESLFDQKILDLESKKQDILDKAEKVEKIKEEQFKKLEQVASLTKEQAKEILLENTEKNVKEDILSRIKKLQNQGAEEIAKKAQQMMVTAIERCSVSHATESTTTTIDLPSDEMKGRIIGREGRNIRAIEQLTGTEIIVDDTPQAITVSGFSPIRRHVAKRAIDKLMQDGRIHPARIEEAIEEAKKEIALEIKKAGEDTLYELGITGVDPKLIQILGRLKYRTSYGQNILKHSIEIANLSALLAKDLGADVSIAKKGGLFHDIGKAVDHEVTGTHPEIGYDILKKFGVSEEVAYIARAHHDDRPETLECVIVKIADAISGARPGARKDTYENYLQRLEELENVATSFDGIEKAYAIQAGREVRVFVAPQQVDDLGAVKLARDIAKKIEEELRYPGEIKVNVIRESRVTEYAR